MGQNSGSRFRTTSVYEREIETKIDMTDLEVLGTLGRGSFGFVQLVKHVKTGTTYALKRLRRAQVMEYGQQVHVMDEKRIMTKLNSPFLIRLHQTYKTEENLYFLQEVALGGELFTILRSRARFDEPTSRFYAACVVLGFEHMHKKNIIYRDLKPENLLLDDKGYLKVTDFGFAKVCTDRTYTLCGTPDYLAPEMVLGEGHGKGIDWWTLGILLFEMLASYPPFYDEHDQMKTYQKIVNNPVQCPHYFSKTAADLVGKLLHKNASKRLGVVKGGVDNIKNHKFFKGFDWQGLEARRLTAPILPIVKNSGDLSNFPPDDDDDGYDKPYVDDGSGWDDDF